MRDRLRQPTAYWDALTQPAAAAVTLAAPPGSGRVTPAAVDAAAAVASHRPYTLVLCVN